MRSGKEAAQYEAGRRAGMREAVEILVVMARKRKRPKASMAWELAEELARAVGAVGWIE